ncbi:MAG: hypothetical protein NUV98_00735 [Candidatus Roizmanbacteria bacterium]|nr:hypothetical protein [Candidatus Roizmanbacteria bacterium]
MNKQIILVTIFLFCILSIRNIGITNSQLVDTVTLTANTFEAFSQEDVLTLDFSLREDKHAVGFTISGNELATFEKLEYLILYDSDQGPQGITGSIDIAGSDEISREDLFLGTCSDSGCYEHTGLSEIYLEIKLANPGEKLLHEQIIY